jgi:ParB-like chromosome segregation protein Spo0J
MKLEWMDIGSVNFSDERFRTSAFSSIEKTLLSIEKIGLVSPLLFAVRDEGLVLVCGWKRAVSCKKLALSPIPFFRIKEEDDLKVFKMAFFENLAARSYTVLEKADIIRKLYEFGENEKDIIRSFLPMLDIPSTWHHFKTYLAVSEFETDLKKAVQEKKMSFPILQLLSEFSAAERRRILPLLLPLGQNKQKELLTDLFELSRKEGVTAEQILQTHKIKTILGSSSHPPLQKSDRVRMILRKKRRPSLSKQEDKVKSILKRISWPQDVEMKSPPFFEGEDFSLSFNFKNEQEYIKRIEQLKNLAARKEFSDLFKSLPDE